VDSIAAEPTIEIRLVYWCSCVDVWKVYQLGAEEAVMRVDLPCVPESCQTCGHNGLCATRRAMQSYSPVEFSDIAVGGPKKYRKLNLAS
jgi:hypothetical protein